MSEITPIGKTDWRNQHQVFGIKDTDRMAHIYCIGKSGVGKSTFLLNMAISDIERGNGLCVIDPHSDLATTLLDYIPEERIDDVIYFNPKDFEYPIAFNPLHNVERKDRHLVVSGLISTFRNIWSDHWGPRLEYILRFSLLTLLEYPEATLLDIQPLLTDPQFRSNVLSYVSTTSVITFWRNEFDKFSPTLRTEAITPILNKIGIFSSSMPLKNVVGKKTSSFTMQEVIDQGKILIVNLSKGELGEEVTSILGSMIITAIQMAALKRARQSESGRRPFYLYVDEMHSYVTLSFASMLAEARKFKLSLFLTHQYIGQLNEKIREAIFGNVGTFISFRIGAEDAGYVSKEFYPIFNESDLVNLSRYSMYIKLMIDGATSKPFSAITLPLKEKTHSLQENIIELSRKKYSKNKELIKNRFSSEQQKDQHETQYRTLF
jgi:hypothetical protein